MSEIVLHHYAGSPFSEKVRLVLGFKGLSWRSVNVPMVMPKPDVMALTGGYRRTPFMQIGADIYCDTALICDVLDEIAPAPALHPPGAQGASRILAQWADSTLFWAAVPYATQPAGAAVLFAGAPPEMAQAFGADRAAMNAGVPRPGGRDAAAQLHSYLAWLESQLADGRPYLCGNAASLADFSTVQSIWFIRRVPPLATILAPHQRLGAWADRVLAIGHGESEKMKSADAIALAKAGQPRAVQVAAGLGFDAGAAVVVTALDYARDPVAGELVGLSQERITLRRVDERAGTVQVHFPRIGYSLKAAK
ncbi:MAG TPA: glutathione S-transferase family protein [Burkholderiaceae bacterium]